MAASNVALRDVNRKAKKRLIYIVCDMLSDLTNIVIARSRVLTCITFIAVKFVRVVSYMRT